MKRLLLIVSLVLFVVPLIVASQCEPSWECEFSDCSGGIQVRMCWDWNDCEEFIYEEYPCGGSAYHGNYPGAGEIIMQSDSGICVEGMRFCGSEGVVQCRDGRLEKIESCIMCEHGFCVKQDVQGAMLFDPVIIFYILSSITILFFGVAIVYFSFKQS